MTPLIAVVGPTASGKTGLAVRIAQRWGAEIVGVDASQVYRGMDIGTGKATADELLGVRHHLLDVAHPHDAFDAQRFVTLADAAIAEIRARGQRVVLCGGTGLYLRALLEGLSEVPPVDPEVARVLRARIDAGEVEALHAELGQVDPVAAARIAPRDKQRIERALSVARSTGRSLTEWHAVGAAQGPRHKAKLLGLAWPREALDARIEARVRQMFTRGLIDEVRGLLQSGLEPSARSLKALGYAQSVAHLEGRCSMDEAIAETVLRSRQYARRQETWFKALPVTWWAPPVADADIAAYLAALP